MDTTVYCLRLLSFWISEPEQAVLWETERKTVPDEGTCVVNSSYLCLSKNPLMLWAYHVDFVTHHQAHWNNLLG